MNIVNLEAAPIQRAQERRTHVPQRADGADDPDYQPTQTMPSRADVLAAQQVQVVEGVPDALYRVYDSFSDVQSCFEALAMGIMGLNQKQLEMILTKFNITDQVQLSDLYFDCDIKCYTKRIAIELSEYFNENKTAIMDHAIENGGCKAVEVRAMNDYCTTQKGTMPKELLGAMANLLGIRIGFSQESKDSIFILFEDGEYKPQFLKEKLHFPNTKEPQQDGSHGLKKELEMSKVVLDALSADSLTIEAMQALFNSILRDRMGVKKILPIIGQTQTGKSSLLNYLLGTFHEKKALPDESDVNQLLRQRIGNGINSKTAVFFQRLLNGFLLTDTPGLGENRTRPMLELMVQYQLIELLSSNSFPRIILTFHESDFTGDLATSGITKLKQFLSKYFDLKAIDGGFYERISTERNTKEFTTCEEWSGFLDEIGSAIEIMAHSPFLTVVKPNSRRSIIKSSDDLLGLVVDTIDEIKSKILIDLEEVLESIPNADTDVSQTLLNIESNILLLIYCLFIKKDVSISDLSEGNDSLREKVICVDETDFNFKDIAIPITTLQPNELVLKEQIKGLLKEPTDNLVKILKVSHLCHEKMLRIQNQHQAINHLRISIDANSNSGNFIEIARLNRIIEGNKEREAEVNQQIQEIQSFLDEFDVDTEVEYPGFPVTKVLMPISGHIFNFLMTGLILGLLQLRLMIWISYSPVMVLIISYFDTHFGLIDEVG